MSDRVAPAVSPEDAPFIESTRCWIEKVVIGENFCPFARRVMAQDAIRFTVCHESDPVEVLQTLMAEIRHLDARPELETGLLILPQGFAGFDAYLDLVELAGQLLVKQGYEGVYQLASFHPEYRFADSVVADAADYTNRSPWPMLHLLREASLERALADYPDPEGIPQRNIEHARARGAAALRALRDACLGTTEHEHEE
jgi:hypothetical protein